jgi:hypothetical protein
LCGSSVVIYVLVKFTVELEAGAVGVTYLPHLLFDCLLIQLQVVADMALIQVTEVGQVDAAGKAVAVRVAEEGAWIAFRTAPSSAQSPSCLCLGMRYGEAWSIEAWYLAMALPTMGSTFTTRSVPFFCVLPLNRWRVFLSAE